MKTIARLTACLALCAFLFTGCQNAPNPTQSVESEDELSESNVRSFGLGLIIVAPGTGTPGYWKNHPDAWPVEEITIAGVTYTKDEAIALISMPTKKDKTRTLFRSLVASILNVIVGNDDSCIADTIADADAWLVANPLGSKVKGNYWTQTGEPMYQQLDAYNNGELCAPSRDSLE